MFEESESIEITKLKNGWQLSHSWKTTDTLSDGRKDTNYHSEAFAYPTLEEATAKITELASKFKD